MRSIIAFCLTFVALLYGQSPAWGLGLLTFGSEFTFYSPEVGVMDNENFLERIPPGSDRVIRRMRQHLIDGQPRGAKFKTGSAGYGKHNHKKGRFTSPNGWYFDWGFDDSVIEIQTNPMTLEDFEKFESDIQDAIFVSAANEGFFPALFLGGGHINMGLSVFEGNDLLLRNFVVDFLFNHNELFLGVLNYDTNNAASIWVQTHRIRREVTKIIAAFDTGEYADSYDSQAEFLSDIQRAMNMESDPCFLKWGTGGNRCGYFAVNFAHAGSGPDARIEFKGVRPQQSMSMWVRQIRLLKKRLLYLERFTEPIAIQPLVPVEKINLSKAVNHLINPPVKAQTALKAFYRFVTESGERWQEHRDYIWPAWISKGELKRFESSVWFLNREAAACEDRL